MHKEEQKLFSELIAIVARLRGPQGCLWDKKQTLQSMVVNLIEEAQEVKEAVDKEDYQNLCEELGDLLMDILLEIQIAYEAGLFDYCQVLSAVKEKFIRRHPHVFGEVQVNSPEEALKVWKKMKEIENDNKKNDK